MTLPSETLVRTTILQGEAKASCDERVIMSTVLGSCVATCLYDPLARVGGMNHYLLSKPLDRSASNADSSYGLFLMELLINEMLKLGAGARVLVFGTEGDTDPALYEELVGRSGAEVRAAQ